MLIKQKKTLIKNKFIVRCFKLMILLIVATNDRTKKPFYIVIDETI